MNEVIWTKRARDNLLAIRLYVGQFNPAAARILADKLIEKSNALANFPYRGRTVPKTNLRELLTVPPYIVRYRIERETIVILRIRHAARRTTKR